ncbi:GNAT family N-acetyltransferase [Pseudomonas sp. HR96]|uniref:GNAT family N-acetyltransferase n=1 Tax=Pseudomonas sp. HR96 TaxID=1027966 RepID=UPI002A74AE74|nr:GNAT family N-acetyltransferase [Pseudomonas sp. HR96]WPP01513.1 GNAT family N-acetyltransferase [Pseudomonas sp. HR96]
MSGQATADIRTLDSGYSREIRALLFQTYRHDSTFAWVFEAEREGYEQRVLATVRQRVKQHFLQDLPALGLLLDDRLVGVALIAPPQRRLGVTESWAWRMRMVIDTGLDCTRRYLEYHDAVMACVPTDAVHVLPMLGLHTDFEGAHFAGQLLAAVHDWCAEDPHSEGVVLDTGNPHYLDFYERNGYQQIGEIAVGPVLEHVFMHPSPQLVERMVAEG